MTNKNFNFQVCPGQEYQRKLHPDDLPLRAQIQRTQKGEKCHFLVRKNPHYPRRKQILPPIIEQQNAAATHSLNNLSTTNGAIVVSSPTYTTTNANDIFEQYNNDRCSNNSCNNSSYQEEICKMCKNSFKSCEFCNKNVTRKLSTRSMSMISSPASSYNPVYNIREIRTVCNSFSSLGIDKKLLEVENNNNNNSNNNNNHNGGSKIMVTNNGNNHNNIVIEAVNNNPSKGYGNFVYI